MVGGNSAPKAGDVMDPFLAPDIRIFSRPFEDYTRTFLSNFSSLKPALTTPLYTPPFIFLCAFRGGWVPSLGGVYAYSLSPCSSSRYSPNFFVLQSSLRSSPSARATFGATAAPSPNVKMIRESWFFDSRVNTPQQIVDMSVKSTGLKLNRAALKEPSRVV